MAGTKEEMAVLRRRRQEKLSPERRKEIGRRAIMARWQRFAQATDIGKVNYIERKLLNIIDDERCDREIVLKAATLNLTPFGKLQHSRTGRENLAKGKLTQRERSHLAMLAKVLDSVAKQTRTHGGVAGVSKPLPLC